MTPRDSALLRDCYDHILLSFAQIHQRHFAGRARPTVANRVSALRRRGLLSVHRMGVVLYQRGAVPVGAVYQVTRRGIKLLQTLFPNDHFQRRPRPLNQMTLMHDLILTDVISALAGRYPSCRITDGRYFQNAGKKGQRVPDAVIEMPDGLMAVELELTEKSEKRYRAIMLQYRTTPQFKRVLYVVAGTAIERQIRFILTGRRMAPGVPELQTGKFEFISLDKLAGTAGVAGGSHNNRGMNEFQHEMARTADLA